MAIKNPTRLIAVTVASLGLAVALTAQAVSSVSTRKAPSIAVSTFPANGLAREALAFQNFTLAVAEEAEPAAAASQVADQALLAVKSDPLAPKAYALIALAQGEAGAGGDLLEAASQLNRRDLNLQSQLLQKHLAAEDYERSINTLDQILRVHPEYASEFFPVLTSALNEPNTVPLFADILDGSSPWHRKFLNFSVRRGGSLTSLAELRPQISSADDIFDKQLIASLAAQGQADAAASIYQLVSVPEVRETASTSLDWVSEYPPFDWQLVDDAGFRSQPSRDGEELELFVRPGKGGLIAGRFLPAPAAPFALRIEHDIKPAHQQEDVSIQMTCTNDGQMVLDRTFEDGASVFQVPSLPADCQFVVLAINARAWTGRTALRGSIGRIAIVPSGETANGTAAATPAP
ncbi:MAG: hypothetical protein ABJ239_04770 [Erythrobacter sp.]